MTKHFDQKATYNEKLIFKILGLSKYWKNCYEVEFEDGNIQQTMNIDFVVSVNAKKIKTNEIEKLIFNLPIKSKYGKKYHCLECLGRGQFYKWFDETKQIGYKLTYCHVCRGEGHKIKWTDYKGYMIYDLEKKDYIATSELG